MKFVISSSDLLKGALAVAKAIPAKATAQIRECFLFELRDGKLDITASDTELTPQTTLDVESSEQDGCIAIPAKHLIELLKELPDQPLTLSVKDASTFECRWSSGQSSLPYFPADDFPQTKGADESAISIDFPAQSLVEGIASTVYATADDEIRPTMNGIYFDICEDSTTLVASDAHKLICYTVPEVKREEPVSFILHKRPAAVLRAIIGKDCENVNIRFDAKTMEFSFDSTLAICRQIPGKFPRYRDVIPQNNSNCLRIDRVMFLNSIRRIAVCSDKASSQIKFSLDRDKLEITAQDLGFSIAAYEKLSCNYDGESIEISFKANFLIEILSNMSCNEVVMKFADSKRAALIVPAEDEDESEKLCGIIMPVMFA